MNNKRIAIIMLVVVVVMIVISSFFGLFNDARDYQRTIQYCKVRSVSGDVVTLEDYKGSIFTYIEKDNHFRRFDNVIVVFESNETGMIEDDVIISVKQY